jgi:hypothetical protein
MGSSLTVEVLTIVLKTRQLEAADNMRAYLLEQAGAALREAAARFHPRQGSFRRYATAQIRIRINQVLDDWYRQAQPPPDDPTERDASGWSSGRSMDEFNELAPRPPGRGGQPAARTRPERRRGRASASPPARCAAARSRTPRPAGRG